MPDPESRRVVRRLVVTALCLWALAGAVYGTRVLTFGADEKLLLVLAATGWIASHGRQEALRRAGNHALLVTVAATLLPHALKAVAWR